MALVLATDYPFGHQVGEGCARYAVRHGHWIIHMRPRRGFVGLNQDWRGDGMVAHVGLRDQEEALWAKPFPVVNTSSLLPGMRLPSVLPDNRAIGRMGADHFLDLGLRTLVFLGFRGHRYSDERADGFLERAREAEAAARHEDIPGFRPEVQSSSGVWNREMAWIDQMLAEFPPPVGVMGANDMLARRVVEACYESGRPVPEEVAVLGVDDDPLHCLTCLPPLSSVRIPYERIGEEAAALLDLLMDGGAPPPGPLRIQPEGVSARASTDLIHSEDPALRRALACIRARFRDGGGVDEIARAAGLSKRSLERRFREALGRTPRQEVQRMRVAAARDLLAATDLPMAEVADRVGLASAERLSVVFRRVAGLPPSAFRRQHRGAGGAARDAG